MSTSYITYVHPPLAEASDYTQISEDDKTQMKTILKDMLGNTWEEFYSPMQVAHAPLVSATTPNVQPTPHS